MQRLFPLSPSPLHSHFPQFYLSERTVAHVKVSFTFSNIIFLVGTFVFSYFFAFYVVILPIYFYMVD